MKSSYGVSDLPKSASTLLSFWAEVSQLKYRNSAKIIKGETKKKKKEKYTVTRVPFCMIFDKEVKTQSFSENQNQVSIGQVCITDNTREPTC